MTMVFTSAMHKYGQAGGLSAGLILLVVWKGLELGNKILH